MPDPFRRCVVIQLAALCLAAASAAQTDTARAAPGRLRLFEADLRTGQPADSSAPVPGDPERPCRHHEDDDDTSGFFSSLLRSVFGAVIDGYAGLPNPGYGPYPYHVPDRFDAYETGSAVRATIGAGYERTHPGISAPFFRASFSAAALVVDASFQSYREDGARMEIAAVRIGARKAPGSTVLWRTHFGWRHLAGGSVLNGALFGTAVEIFPGGGTAIALGYDLDLFPKYGTVFHDLTGSCSYFLGRTEFTAGYNGLITYKGSSLHGPFAGISWHF